MAEFNAIQKNKLVKKLKGINKAKEKDILNLKVSELRKINEDENIPNLTINDVEIIWQMQDAIKGKELLEYLTDIK
jgi:hypothetical protein